MEEYIYQSFFLHFFLQKRILFYSLFSPKEFYSSIEVIVLLPFSSPTHVQGLYLEVKSSANGPVLLNMFVHVARYKYGTFDFGMRYTATLDLSLRDNIESTGREIFSRNSEGEEGAIFCHS